MKNDKIIYEYLKGKLPFSDLYRRSNEGENCPEDLASQLTRKATRNGAIWMLLRSQQSKRIWVEAVLLVAAITLLALTLFKPTGAPELECPKTPDQYKPTSR